MNFSRLYSWEMETSDGTTLKQYEDDGKENTWTTLDVDKVVRVSIVPTISVLPRHDCFIDISKGERFIRRFRRVVQKKSQTNLDTLMENCYKVNRNMTIIEAFQLFNDTQDGDLFSVFVTKHLRLDEKSDFFKQLIERYGADATIDTIVGRFGFIKTVHKWGVFLDFLGFPKNENKESFIECITTNRYRMWIFSSGKVLITRPDYEVYI